VSKPSVALYLWLACHRGPRAAGPGSRPFPSAPPYSSNTGVGAIRTGNGFPFPLVRAGSAALGTSHKAAAAGGPSTTNRRAPARQTPHFCMMMHPAEEERAKMEAAVRGLISR